MHRLFVVLVVDFRLRIRSLKVLAGLLAGLFSLTPAKAAVPEPPPLAAPCTLAWEPSPTPAVTGYAIYFAAAGSSVTNRIDVGMTNQATLLNLYVTSNYVFYVVAYEDSGIESPPSNLVSYSPSLLSWLNVAVAATGTVNLQFSAAPGTPCHIEYTPLLNPPQWQTLGSATADTNGNVTLADTLPVGSPSRFYRAATP